MSPNLPIRFWFEVVTAVSGMALFVVTMISREWFELLTGLDPDGGSGALEVTLVIALLAVSAASMFAARRDYRRATA